MHPRDRMAASMMGGAPQDGGMPPEAGLPPGPEPDGDEMQIPPQVIAQIAMQVVKFLQEASAGGEQGGPPGGGAPSQGPPGAMM
jgi:hypothetical protein